MCKIAILSCSKAAAKCCGIDCLRFLAERDRSFREYADQEVQLAGFTTCCGCGSDPRTSEDFSSKIAHLLKAGVTEVHISSCVTSEKRNCPQKDAMFNLLRSNGLARRFIAKKE